MKCKHMLCVCQMCVNKMKKECPLCREPTEIISGCFSVWSISSWSPFYPSRSYCGKSTMPCIWVSPCVVYYLLMGSFLVMYQTISSNLMSMRDIFLYIICYVHLVSDKQNHVIWSYNGHTSRSVWAFSRGWVSRISWWRWKWRACFLSHLVFYSSSSPICSLHCAFP